MKKLILLAVLTATSASAQILNIPFFGTFDLGPLAGTGFNGVVEIDTQGNSQGIADLNNGQLNFIEITLDGAPLSFFDDLGDPTPSATYAPVGGSPELVGIDLFTIDAFTGDTLNVFFDAFQPDFDQGFSISYLPDGGTLGTNNDESVGSTVSGLLINVPEASATFPILALFGLALIRRRA